MEEGGKAVADAGASGTKTGTSLKQKLSSFYDRRYKQLLIIPVILFLLSFAVIGYNQLAKGEVIGRDVSLKGGVTITITTAAEPQALEHKLAGSFQDVSVRTVTQGGKQVALIVDASATTTEEIAALTHTIESTTGVSRNQYAVQVIGSALGASFFRQALIAVALAFAFMGITVLLYFRNIVPALFVILSAFGDILMPFSLLALLGVKLSTAGLAAFLMLIGYSVDTDILLTTRVLRAKEGTLHDRIVGAFRTGITMTLTALVAVLVGYFVSQSDVIKQIMLVLSVGLVFDIINTWITNAGILRWYLERKQGAH